VLSRPCQTGINTGTPSAQTIAGHAARIMQSSIALCSQTTIEDSGETAGETPNVAHQRRQTRSATRDKRASRLPATSRASRAVDNEYPYRMQHASIVDDGLRLTVHA
jgi:hypothetical protein